jgi:hypothetical protein
VKFSRIAGEDDDCLSGKAAYPVLLKPPEKLGHSLKRPPRQLSVIMLNNKKAGRSQRDGADERYVWRYRSRALTTNYPQAAISSP